jgi:predicted RNA polymerase sigma factor
MASGPEAALELLAPLSSHPLMKNYHLLPSVRGDLLARLGRHTEAIADFELAASLTHNERERILLNSRAEASRIAQHEATVSRLL